MSDFDGIEVAQSSAKLPNILPGTYVFEVEALKLVTTRSKGKMFIAEFKVADASSGGNPVGTKCSNVIKMSLDSALGNIKGIAAAVLSEPEKTITGQTVDQLVSDANPAKGVKVRATASMIKTKAGTDFTLVSYAPFEGAAAATPPPQAGATTSTARARK